MLLSYAALSYFSQMGKQRQKKQNTDRMRDCLPADAHLRCSGKVFVSITVFDPCKGPAALSNKIVSEFKSRDDLLNACMASSAIPYISDDGVGRIYDGNYVLDGGFINNTPFFHDNKRRQIVCRLSKVRSANIST